MKKALSILLFAAFSLAVAGEGAAAPVDPVKRAEIEKLLVATGAMNMSQQFSAAMIDSVVKAVRAAQPKLTEKGAAIISAEVNAVIADHVGELKDRVVDVYDRYYTLDDVRALNAFYATPAGRKVIATMPSVLKDSIATGQEWGRSLGPEIERRIQKRCTTDCTAK